jgi:16S rRNA (uracil1498-N3)-methyltransferase
MPRYDFRSPRLFVEAALGAGNLLQLDATQSHYLANVLRLRSGDNVLVFNGRDGEWKGEIEGAGKRGVTLRLQECVREQSAPCDLQYIFAPLKHARLDYMVQKAVEMGASRLQPVMTRHAQTERVNLGRMRANVIEAAEQCGILNVAEVLEPLALPKLLAQHEPERLLIFCDEDAEVADPLDALNGLRANDARPSMPLAVLIGPEGGFAEEERKAILRLPRVVRLALGPRILRADTAAVAALALVQAVLGDWRG